MWRDDERWLEDRWADPATRVLVIAGARVRPVAGRLDWVAPAEAPAGLRVLLGERDGVEHFAVIVDPDDAPGPREEWLVLRSVVQSLADETIAEGPLVLHAIGLAEWLWATRHCPRCGGSLEPRQAGHVLRCTSCGRDQFPRSDPAVIMVVTDGEPGSQDERALLGRSPAWPEGRYSTLAGFVEPGETMEDAVRREVEE
jgi:NAD+ diphosphatase